MKTTSIIIIALIAFQLLPACSCIGGNFTYQFNAANKVFIGIPFDIECTDGSHEDAKNYDMEIENYSGEDGKPIDSSKNINLRQKDLYCSKRIKIQTFKSFKGDNSLWQYAFSGSGGGDCGITNIKIGVPYVFYTWTHNKKNFISICDNTSEIVKNNDEITLLKIGHIEEPQFIKENKKGNAFKFESLVYDFEKLIKIATSKNNKYSVYQEYSLIDEVLRIIINNEVDELINNSKIESEFVDSISSHCIKAANKRIDLENEYVCSNDSFKNICKSIKSKKIDRLNSLKRRFKNKDETLIRELKRYRIYQKLSLEKHLIGGNLYLSSIGQNENAVQSIKLIIKNKVEFLDSELKVQVMQHLVTTNKDLVDAEKIRQFKSTEGEIENVFGSICNSIK